MGDLFSSSNVVTTIAALGAFGMGAIVMPKRPWYRAAQAAFLVAAVVAQIKIMIWASTSSQELVWRVSVPVIVSLAAYGLAVAAIWRVQGHINEDRPPADKPSVTSANHDECQKTIAALENDLQKQLGVASKNVAESRPEAVKSNDTEPEIVGKILESHLYPQETVVVGGMNLYVILKIQIRNKGVPTGIQGYRLILTILGKSFECRPEECRRFSVIRLTEREERETLIDLRMAVTPLERHLPREGWLCFRVDKRLPRMNLGEDVHFAEVKFTLVAIDAADGEHLLVRDADFQQPVNARAESVV